MDGILKDILLYLFILFVLTTTAYTAQDPQMFQQNEAVKKDILNGLYVQNSSHDTKECGIPVRGIDSKTTLRYDLSPVFRPCQNGELVDRAKRCGMKYRA